MNSEQIESLLNYNNLEERNQLKSFFTQPESLDRSKHTIVFSTPSETGTSYFRLFEPLKALWRNYRDEANYLYTEQIQPGHMKIADCVIMHRAGNLHSYFLKAAQFWPKTETRPLIIHDVDDNEFNLPKTHPMAELWYESKKDKMSLHGLKNSDLVTTTTHNLERTFKNFNNNVKIFRNMFDWNLPQWNIDRSNARNEMTPEWDRDKIVIGWAGLTSHFEDLKRMQPMLKYIHDNYPDTVFILAGMALKDSNVVVEEDENGNKRFVEKEITDEGMRYRNRVENLYSCIDKDRIKIFDALPLEEYGKFYSLFDISMSFVEHNAFNKCKSEIKVIESLRYGCVPIFSNFGGYSDFWREVPQDIKTENISISVTAPKIWQRSIEYWVKELRKIKSSDNKMKIHEDILKLKEYSDKKYDINEHCEDRLTYLIENIEEHRNIQINQTSKYINVDDLSI